MSILSQMFFRYWSPVDLIDLGHESSEPENASIAEPHPINRPGRAAERTVHYRTLIELRRVLQNFRNPATTTVLLVIDSDRNIHLPTLLARDEYAFRLILTSSATTLLGTLSAGDLALRARGWGWNAITYKRDLQQALAAARESTTDEEELLILAPSWLPLDC